MTRALLAVSLFLSLAACGPEASVSSDFTGRWTGETVVSAPGQTPTAIPNTSLVLAANGQSLTATGFCPDGSGAMTATGQEGRTVGWSGSFACSYSTAPCAVVTNTYTNATMALDSGNTLTVVAYSNLVACGRAYAATTTFTGRK